MWLEWLTLCLQLLVYLGGLYFSLSLIVGTVAFFRLLRRRSHALVRELWGAVLLLGGLVLLLTSLLDLMALERLPLLYTLPWVWGFSLGSFGLLELHHRTYFRFSFLFVR